jgi:RNA-directed DNA polymerase
MKKTSNKMQLTMLGLPVIDSLDDFSSLTHLSNKVLYYFSKYSNSYYKAYEIPKKSGGMRTIAQPSYELKALQSWILNNILLPLRVSPACKGFEKKTSILDNARPHVGANVVLSLDLNDFFPSIKANQVCSIFKAIGYNPRIAAILTSICTYNGALPQGGPCSPKLANLVCLRLDARLQGFVGKRGITFTRYADDLAFSSFAPNRLLSSSAFIKRIIVDEGFKINNSKTRVAGPARAKKITGLIVTEGYVGIGRKRLHEIRSKLYYFSKKKLSHDYDKDLNHIKGWLAFIKSIDEQRWKILNAYIARLKKNDQDSAISLI